MSSPFTPESCTKYTLLDPGENIPLVCHHTSDHFLDGADRLNSGQAVRIGAPTSATCPNARARGRLGAWEAP